MLTSFAFFPGYTKGRLSHGLLETGLPGMGRQGAALLTPYAMDPHRRRQQCCLVAEASERPLVLTPKTIRKSFLLLCFPTPALALSPFSPPPPHTVSPFFFSSSFPPLPSIQPPCLSPSHGADLPACEASPSSWASSLESSVRKGSVYLSCAAPPV